MKKSLLFVLFVLLTVSLISCDLFSKDKDPTCNHVWETKLVGGKGIAEGASGEPVAATLVKTCVKCGAKVGEEVQISEGLTYSDGTVSCPAYEDTGALIIPAQYKSAGGDIVDVTTIGDFSLGLFEEVYIPEGVTTITDSAFNSCYVLEKVHVANTVTSLGDGTFMSCYGLREVKLPDVEDESNPYQLTAGLFTSCYNLRKVTPEVLVNNDNYDLTAFDECYILIDKYELSND